MLIVLRFHFYLHVSRLPSADDAPSSRPKPLINAAPEAPSCCRTLDLSGRKAVGWGEGRRRGMGDSGGGDGGRWSKTLRKSFTPFPKFGRDFKSALRSA